MDAGKWFRVLVLGGGALACGGPERSADAVTEAAEAVVPAVVVDAGATDAGVDPRGDAGALAGDAGRRCVVSGPTVRFEDEPVGACCIWGGELHPCCG